MPGGTGRGLAHSSDAGRARHAFAHRFVQDSYCAGNSVASSSGGAAATDLRLPAAAGAGDDVSGASPCAAARPSQLTRLIPASCRGPPRSGARSRTRWPDRRRRQPTRARTATGVRLRSRLSPQTFALGLGGRRRLADAAADGTFAGAEGASALAGGGASATGRRADGAARLRRGAVAGAEQASADLGRHQHQDDDGRTPEERAQPADPLGQLVGSSGNLAVRGGRGPGGSLPACLRGAARRGDGIRFAFRGGRDRWPGPNGVAASEVASRSAGVPGFRLRPKLEPGSSG